MRILYFSHIRWQEIKQRPQFIAEGLAAIGHQLDYVCRIPLGKGGDFVSNLSDRLRVKSIFVLPLALKIAPVERVNSYLVRKMIDWDSYDVIIVTEPRLRACLPVDLRVPIIYDCMDYAPGFYSGRAREYIREEEQRLVGVVDRIIVSSFTLYRTLVKNYGVDKLRISVVKNAAADDFIEKMDSESVEKLLAGRKPQMLYVGTIDFWFDWESVIAFAETHPDVLIMLVGPARCTLPVLPENIVCMGKIPHHSISALLCSSKILLLPFLKCDLIDCVDPVKFYEYISVGKTVISANWEEMRSLKDTPGVFFYNNPGEFCEIAQTILKKDQPSRINRAFHAENCWRVRVRTYDSILRELVADGVTPP